MIFVNRVDAGQKLGEIVVKKVQGTGLVLGIPRGGVVVAKIVADKLAWPLDVLAAKKVGAPGNPELAIGARVKPTSLNVQGKEVILVDDGIATGHTMAAAINYLRRLSSQVKIVVAVPVCAQDTVERLKPLVDQWFCLHEAPDMMAIGQFYEEFEQ